jgi:hypothetical protein
MTGINSAMDDVEMGWLAECERDADRGVQLMGRGAASRDGANALGGEPS